MTSLLAAIALAPAVYQAPPASPQTYTMKAEFNGFVPVLGGNEGKVEVVMGVAVAGLDPKDSLLRATTDINRFELKFNEAPLPFGLEMVQDFFPKATVTFTPLGKVTANTTPNRALPVNLPGLDPRRLPELTFLPVELPEHGVEAGKTWTFERQFGPAPMKYSCRIQSLTTDVAVIGVSVTQAFEYLENEALETVTREADAVAKVKASLTGSGKVWMNLTTGLVEGVQMRNESVAESTPLKKGTKATRKLISRLEVTRGAWTFPKEGQAGSGGQTAAPGGGSRPTAKPAASNDLAGQLMSFGQQLWGQASSFTATLRTLWNLALIQFPLLRNLLPF